MNGVAPRLYFIVSQGLDFPMWDFVSQQWKLLLDGGSIISLVIPLFHANISTIGGNKFSSFNFQ